MGEMATSDMARRRGLGTPLMACGLLLVLWALVYLPGLATQELRSEEGRRAQPGLTMLETGQWAQPYIGGEPYYAKPPMINWVAAASFALTGQANEWTARIPSTLGVLGLALWIALGRSGWLDARERLVGAVLVLTTASIIEKGRLIEIEALYVCASGIAMVSWLNGWSRGRRGLGLWFWPGVFLGIGMLLKGPPHVYYFYLIVLPVLAQERGWSVLYGPGHLLALALTLGPFLVWSALAAQAPSNETGAMTGTWLAELAQRIIPADFDAGEYVSHFVEAVTNFLPWAILVPLLFSEGRVSAMGGHSQVLFRGARLGVCVGLLTVMMLPGSLPRYTLPLLVPAAVLTAKALAAAPPPAVLPRGAALGVTLALGAGAALGIGTLWVDGGIDLRAIWPVLCAAGALVALHAVRHPPAQLGPTVAAGALTMVLLVHSYAAFVAPEFERISKLRPFAATVNHLVPAGQPVAVFRPGYEAFVFYLREPVVFPLGPEEASRHDYLLIEATDWAFLREAGHLQEYRVLYQATPRIQGNWRLVARPSRRSMGPPTYPETRPLAE